MTYAICSIPEPQNNAFFLRHLVKEVKHVVGSGSCASRQAPVVSSCKHSNEILCSIEAWLAERVLISQKENCSMKLVALIIWSVIWDNNTKIFSEIQAATKTFFFHVKG
jgi:hypothetical protein